MMMKSNVDTTLVWPNVDRNAFERSPGDETAWKWSEMIFGEDPAGVGEDPDYRFSMANERTFLAWIRTSLALAAGGLGALHLISDSLGSEALGIFLLALSFVTAATSYRRWADKERAMRLGEPFPASRLPQFLAAGVALLGVVAAILFVVDQL